MKDSLQPGLKFEFFSFRSARLRPATAKTVPYLSPRVAGICKVFRY